MIRDMRTNFAKAYVDNDAQAQIEAAHAKWQAELRLFKGNLILDQKLINKMEFGSRALHDILEWNDAEQVRQQCIIGKSLVKQFMDHYMPKATASNWSDVPGAVALVVQNIQNRSALRTHLVFLQSYISTPRTHAIPSKFLRSRMLLLTYSRTSVWSVAHF